MIVSGNNQKNPYGDLTDKQLLALKGKTIKVWQDFELEASIQREVVRIINDEQVRRFLESVRK